MDDDDDVEDDVDSKSLSAVVVLAFDDDGAAVGCLFSISSAISPQSTLERSCDNKSTAYQDIQEYHLR